MRSLGRMTARVIGLEAEYAAMAARVAAVPQDDGAESGSLSRPKRQRRTAMAYFAELDVSMEETSICAVDQEGKVVLETKVATDPDAIFNALKKCAPRLRRSVMTPVHCRRGCRSSSSSAASRRPASRPGMCGRHCRRCATNDKADARGIAHIMLTGRFRKVHVESDESYRLRLRLTQRRNLKRKVLVIENTIRHSIQTFGLKVGHVSRGQFKARVRELVAGDELIAGLTDCMLRARAATRFARFMRIPGVGPISALAYKTAVDDPQRFRHSKTVGAYSD